VVRVVLVLVVRVDDRRETCRRRSLDPEVVVEVAVARAERAALADALPLDHGVGAAASALELRVDGEGLVAVLLDVFDCRTFEKLPGAKALIVVTQADWESTWTMLWIPPAVSRAHA
jgi:hypothetical protein